MAKVNGELWDLDRPFEKDSSLQLLKFEDPEGMFVHTRYQYIFIQGQLIYNISEIKMYQNVT